MKTTLDFMLDQLGSLLTSQHSWISSNSALIIARCYIVAPTIQCAYVAISFFEVELLCGWMQSSRWSQHVAVACEKSDRVVGQFLSRLVLSLFFGLEWLFFFFAQEMA